MNGLIALILFFHHMVLCALLLYIVVIFIAVVFSVVLVVIQVSEDRLLNWEHLLLLLINARWVTGDRGGFFIRLLAIFVIGHTVGVGKWRFNNWTMLRGSLHMRWGRSQVKVWNLLNLRRYHSLLLRWVRRVRMPCETVVRVVCRFVQRLGWRWYLLWHTNLLLSFVEPEIFLCFNGWRFLYLW